MGRQPNWVLILMASQSGVKFVPDTTPELVFRRRNPYPDPQKIISHGSPGSVGKKSTGHGYSQVYPPRQVFTGTLGTPTGN
jgi:hypothetical protein